MPTYQYACTECGHQLEAVQSFTDEPLQECPSCTGRLRKVFNSVGIVFKGSGFYRTDSRNGEGKGTANGANSSEKSDKKDSSTTKPSTGSSESAASSSTTSNGSGTGGSTTTAKAPAAANSASS
ncbi:FmdB family zinc ribbon protein [Solwaraspora sp. WMMB335]|uniref:FmdB family zinc ribbon protein n=1 Tax=Solwaraspora sp. WMMB335 TaxID=3404118 RepID=UPI003B93A77B